MGKVRYGPLGDGRSLARQEEERRRNAPNKEERERVFLLTMCLGKGWERNKMLRNVWGKLELEAPWLWWSVGEGGEGDAYSRLPWKL